MSLTKIELKALAMHELMVREQRKLRERSEEQQKLTTKSDDYLKELVYGKGAEL